MSPPAADAQACIFLLQLGGPADLAGIEPFLANLFADVLPLPGWLRGRAAGAIARRRAPKVAPLYAEMGGGSPLLGHTQAQAEALSGALAARGRPAHIRVCMRYAPPRAAEQVAWARAHAATLPWLALSLYPQYSFATARSSLRELDAQLSAAERAALRGICAYPADPDYLAAVAAQIEASLAPLPAAQRDAVHLVFSAHGLPMSLVRQGDPYPQHIAASVAGTLARLGRRPAGWTLSYQSRVGPVKWLSPATDQTLRALGRAGVRQVLVVPIAFVSEHIETLQELDVELAAIAREAGITTFLRAPAVGTQPRFIDALAGRVEAALAQPGPCCGAFADCERRGGPRPPAGAATPAG